MTQWMRPWGRRMLAGTGQRWRRAIADRADTAAGVLTGRSLMVIAPHADDETLGCGALLARACADGVQVTVVVATDGRYSTESGVLTPDELAALRAAELHSACARLGVPEQDVHLLGFPDSALGSQAGLLADEIKMLLAERLPDVVLIPTVQDVHPDHRAVYQATLQAVDAVGHHCLVLAYPIWAWYSGPWFLDAPPAHRPRLWAWAARQAARGGWWQVPCGSYLRDKGAALSVYESQTTNLTGEPSWSHMGPDFLDAFLAPAELFLPVRPRLVVPARSEVLR